MTEMIERVAKALCQQDEQNGAAPWDWYDDKGHERYRESARAAIKAMREVTLAMAEAAEEAERSYSGGDDFSLWGRQWDAMIDAALAE